MCELTDWLFCTTLNIEFDADRDSALSPSTIVWPRWYFFVGKSSSKYFFKINIKLTKKIITLKSLQNI